MLNAKLQHLKYYIPKYRQFHKKVKFDKQTTTDAYINIVIHSSNNLFYSFNFCNIAQARIQYYRLLHQRNYNIVPIKWDKLYIKEILVYGNTFKKSTCKMFQCDKKPYRYKNKAWQGVRNRRRNLQYSKIFN